MAKLDIINLKGEKTSDIKFISVGCSKYDILIEKASEFLDKLNGEEYEDFLVEMEN